MKSLKNVLLAAGLVVSTMGMSLSANAVIIQQDILIDIQLGDHFDIGLGINETLNQLIGSVLYNPNDADDNGQISLADISVSLDLGAVALTNADVMLGGPSPILLAMDFLADGALSLILDFEFTFNDVVTNLTLETDTDFGGYFLIEDQFGSLTIGETRLGAVNVSEPSALIIMLAGMGFLVRRKIAAK